MSKVKELERMLVAATNLLYRVRRHSDLDLSEFEDEDVSAKELLKWRSDRRKELAGTKTVEAKVVTKVVEKDREKKDRSQTVKRESKADRRKRNEDVHKAIEPVIKGKLTKSVLMKCKVHTSRYSKHTVVGVVRRNGERSVRLDNGLVVPVARLRMSAPNKLVVMPE